MRVLLLVNMTNDFEDQKQVDELTESAKFVQSFPDCFAFIAQKIFHELDSNHDEQISWREIEQSFLGNIEKLPFENKTELKDCFSKWTHLDSNTNELNFEEFSGFLKELMEILCLQDEMKKETVRRQELRRNYHF
ncbi:uncharacterized protein LOC142343994 isoform X2 [Convolutriloba macropyga]|uniref:uncharacterized protein LOC142343994 isoform X2 n=1 Tax=Convolutriloba macropyga TaxID=536237 RepID=UPI003F522B30